MKKLGLTLLIIIALCGLLAVSAFASAEPGALPAEESLPVTIQVNGEEYRTVDIVAAVEGNVYTFQISELMDALGIQLSYDEEAAVVTVSAVPGGLTGESSAIAAADGESPEDAENAARGTVALRESDMVTRKLAERSAARASGTAPAASRRVVLRDSDMVTRKLAERSAAPTPARRVVLRDSAVVVRKLAERNFAPV